MRPSTIRTEPSNTLPMMLSCRQTSPSTKLAVGGQAGELGAGAGAAGGAVVGLAGAKHEVLAVAHPAPSGGPNELDVVDLAPSAPVIPCAVKAWRIRQVTSVSRSTLASAQGLAVILHQEEPVPAPGDVAHVGLESRHRHRHVLGQAIALDVVDRHGIAAFERDRHQSDRRLEPVRAGPDPPQVGQRDRHADRAVAAHAEVADVVEEDHAGRAGRIDRRQQGSPRP